MAGRRFMFPVGKGSSLGTLLSQGGHSYSARSSCHVCFQLELAVSKQPCAIPLVGSLALHFKDLENCMAAYVTEASDPPRVCPHGPAI